MFLVLSSQHKWKYGSYKVSIASQRLLENKCVCMMVNTLFFTVSGILHHRSHTVKGADPIGSYAGHSSLAVKRVIQVIFYYSFDWLGLKVEVPI